MRYANMIGVRGRKDNTSIVHNKKTGNYYTGFL